MHNNELMCHTKTKTKTKDNKQFFCHHHIIVYLLNNEVHHQYMYQNINYRIGIGVPLLGIPFPLTCVLCHLTCLALLINYSRLSSMTGPASRAPLNGYFEGLLYQLEYIEWKIMNSQQNLLHDSS